MRTARGQEAPDSPADPATTTDDVERLDLKQAMNKLSGLQREVIALHYFAGFSLREVARILGAVLQTDHPLATISSGSMWPALKTGDIVLLQGADSVEDLNVGDIIAFRHEGGLAIHRIVRIEDEQITTRGDANIKEDTPIVFDNVIGRAVKVGGRLARVPYLGHLAELLGPVVGTSTDDPGQPELVPSEGSAGPGGGP